MAVLTSLTYTLDMMQDSLNMASARLAELELEPVADSRCRSCGATETRKDGSCAYCRMNHTPPSSRRVEVTAIGSPTREYLEWPEPRPLATAMAKAFL